MAASHFGALLVHNPGRAAARAVIAGIGALALHRGRREARQSMPEVTKAAHLDTANATYQIFC